MFDWSLAEGAPSNRRVILAGGLTPENIAEAITRVRPWGVDVSTGVESEPGRKDARKVRDFVRNAKQAAPRRYHGDEEERPFDWQEDDYR
jgi:phosphoribosylanthranilate isomerase